MSTQQSFSSFEDRLLPAKIGVSLAQAILHPELGDNHRKELCKVLGAYDFVNAFGAVSAAIRSLGEREDEEEEEDSEVEQKKRLGLLLYARLKETTNKIQRVLSAKGK